MEGKRVVSVGAETETRKMEGQRVMGLRGLFLTLHRLQI